MFGGVHIIEVEPGTEIEHEGKKLAVTDEQAVHRGNAVYVTRKAYGALRSKSRPAKEGR